MQRFGSEVRHLSARKADDDRFTVAPIEAADAFAAAHHIAEIAARRRYEDAGEVGYLQFEGTDGWYRAAIGVQQRSDDGITTRGVSVLIHVWPVEEALEFFV